MRTAAVFGAGGDYGYDLAARGGATIDDLKLMRKHSPEHVQVKAAGGIRDLNALLEVRALGVTRVGASRTTDILDSCKLRLGVS